MSNPPSAADLLSLSTTAGEAMRAATLTIALAESCTGGLLASTLTDVAGSSDYVVGGVVSYSNQAKMQLLGVSPATLADHGAVSAETAAEMAQGARRLFGCDIAIAITGIAGPGGGTAAKPVGLVYQHLSAEGGEWGEHAVWPYDRQGNKVASVAAALRLLLRYLGREAVQVAKPSEIVARPLLVEAEWQEGWWSVRAVWLDNERVIVTGQGRQTARAGRRRGSDGRVGDGRSSGLAGRCGRW